MNIHILCFDHSILIFLFLHALYAGVLYLRLFSLSLLKTKEAPYSPESTILFPVIRFGLILDIDQQKPLTFLRRVSDSQRRPVDSWSDRGTAVRTGDGAAVRFRRQTRRLSLKQNTSIFRNMNRLPCLQDTQ